MTNCVIVGLTGQTGAGKTTVSKIFSQNGFAAVNCDTIARNVTSQGSECCKALAEIFPECFDESLSLDRKALANIVFNDNEKLKLLNDTIFPFITADIKKAIEDNIKSGNRYILLDAPTLFEAGADELCSCIVSCVADDEIRLKRIMQRDDITEDMAKSRMASQLSETFFKEHSNYIVENNGSLEDAKAAATGIIMKIKGTDNG